MSDSEKETEGKLSRAVSELERVTDEKVKHKNENSYLKTKRAELEERKLEPVK